VHFQDFHDALFRWWQASRDWVQQELAHIVLPESGLEAWTVFDRLFKGKPFSLPEWRAVEETVMRDERLASQIGRVTGSYLWRGTALTITGIGEAFCDEAMSEYLGDKDFPAASTDARFETLYLRLDEYLAADVLYYDALIPLIGLVCDPHPIALEEGITLEEIDERDPSRFELQMAVDSIRPARRLGEDKELPQQYRFRLHLRYALPKLIGDDTYDAALAAQFYADVEQKTRDCLRSIAAVTFSRIVAWPARIQDRSFRFGDVRGLTLRTPRIAVPIFTSGATLGAAHAAAIPYVWQRLRHPQFATHDANRAIGIALDRMARLGANMQSLREQLVDTVIACEAFFTLGRSAHRQELGFRASMAAAFSGANDVGFTKRTVFHMVDCAYDLRSKIVHGSELKPKDLTFEAAPATYPEATDDRINFLVVYIVELVRMSLLRALLGEEAGTKIVIDWDERFFD
jgi:hypothetical protein